MGFIQDKRRGKVGERVVKGYFEANEGAETAPVVDFGTQE